MVQAKRRDPDYRAPDGQLAEAQRLRAATRDEFDDFIGIERRLRIERLRDGQPQCRPDGGRLRRC